MYEVNSHEYTGNNFYADSNYPHIVAARMTAAAISKYAPVAVDADGKLTPVTVTANGEDGTTALSTEGLYGIALEEATAADKLIPVALTGEILSSALVLSEGVTASALEVEFRKLGIFLK